MPYRSRMAAMPVVPWRRGSSANEGRPIAGHSFSETLFFGRFRQLGPTGRCAIGCTENIGQLAGVEGVQTGSVRGRIPVIENLEKGMLAGGCLFRGDALGSPAVQRVARLAPARFPECRTPGTAADRRPRASRTGPGWPSHKPPPWRARAARESAMSGSRRY